MHSFRCKRFGCTGRRVSAAEGGGFVEAVEGTKVVSECSVVVNFDIL